MADQNDVTKTDTSAGQPSSTYDAFILALTLMSLDDRKQDDELAQMRARLEAIEQLFQELNQ